MCREYKYQANCKHKHVLGERPPQYEECQDYRDYMNGSKSADPRLDPHNCIQRDSANPIIDTRRGIGQCTICQRAIVPAEFNLAKDITETVNRQHYQNIKAGRPTDQVLLPEITQLRVRQLIKDRLKPGDRTPDSRSLSSFTSPLSSSDQQTDVVYDQEGNAHQRGVSGTDPAKGIELESLKGEWTMLYNNPDIDEDMRQEFLPELEHRDRIIKYAHGVRKKPEE